MSKDFEKLIPDQLPDYMVIGGERVASSSGEVIETFDPATDKLIGTVPAASVDDVERAVDCARQALTGPWRDTTPTQRGRLLNRVAQRIRKDAEKIAAVETLDSGKPLSEARGDVETAAGYFEYYAGIADKLEGDSIPLGRDFMSFTVREPVGVTSHIIPWNFPLVTTARGLAPALAAGNTAVVKPAQQTPISAVMLADILEQEGLPAGVNNVVTGSGRVVGDPLTSLPDIAHVTFTGSVETGKTVMTRAAQAVASVTLELGGKSPVVVLADADIDAAVEGILKAIYMNAGQVCSSGSRLVIERSVHAELMDKLVQRANALSIDHGLNAPQMGPLVSHQQRDLVAGFVDRARQNGAEIVAGGRKLELEGLERGCFYAPTIIDNLPLDHECVQEEIFGPVLAVQIVDSAEEAIAVSNGTRFGLCAGIYSRDIGKALRYARDVESGQVFINQYFAGGIQTPFGGVKESGFGREKGLAALASYYQVKCITARI